MCVKVSWINGNRIEYNCTTQKYLQNITKENSKNTQREIERESNWCLKRVRSRTKRLEAVNNNR